MLHISFHHLCYRLQQLQNTAKICTQTKQSPIYHISFNSMHQLTNCWCKRCKIQNACCVFAFLLYKTSWRKSIRQQIESEKAIEEGRGHCTVKDPEVCVFVCAIGKGSFQMSKNTSWMWGCIVSMCVHPRHSRGLVPGSIQHKLGHTGDIC